MKKILSIVLAVALVLSTLVMPVLAEDATPEYYLKGIYNGAVIVAQEETSRVVTVIDVANKDTVLDTATDVAKVVFTFNNVETEVDVAPFSYTMEFSTPGAQTLKYDVYKTGNETETPDQSETITFTVVAGTKNVASFTEDFEDIANDADALKKAIVGNDGANIHSYNKFSKVTFNGSAALEIDNTATSGGAREMQLRGAASSTGHKVHYYEFDMATDYTYAHCLYVRGKAYYSGDNQIKLLDAKYSKTDGTTYLFNDINTYKKLRIVLDYNESPTATLYVDGKEYTRVSMADVVTGGNPSLVLEVNPSGGLIHIDNFKYSVYDKVVEGITPEYFVKGIYDDAVIVAQEEESRQITVVDAANKVLALESATNVAKVEFYKDDVLVAIDDVAPFTYNLKFDNYGTHKFQAKVYEVFGNVFDTFVYDYKVVNGVKNVTESIPLQDYEGTFADATALKETITSYNETESKYMSSYIQFSTATVANSTALMLDARKDDGTERGGALKLKGASPATGHQVHYYEFDMAVNSNNRQQLLVRGTNDYSSGDNQQVLIDTKSSKIDSSAYLFMDYHNKFRKVRVVLDYNESPTVLVYIDGKEYKNISLKNLYENEETGATGLVFDLNASGVVYLDNFKYTVYDVDDTVNFGTAVYAREYDVADGNVTITTGATNTSGTAGSLINIIAVYDGSDRLLAVKEFDAVDYANGDFKTQTYNVPVNEEGAVKVRVFTLNGNGTIAPVSLYK